MIHAVPSSDSELKTNILFLC